MFGLIISPWGRRGMLSRTVVATVTAASLVVTAGCSSSDNGKPAASPPTYAGGTLATSGVGTPSTAASGSPGGASSTAPGGAPASRATTAGRTPSGGGIDQTVPSRPMVTKAPVALRSRAEFGGRISARISDITAIKATGQGPGEISGPALRVTFTITNGSSRRLGLGAVTANLTDSTGAPAVSLTGKPAAPFSGSAAPGASRTGVYVFSVATDRRSPVTISLNYAADAAVVLFKGSAS